MFYFGTRKKDALVPSGILQNTAESSIGFVRNQIIMQTMGVDGLGYLPYLATLFFFIFFSNITEILPGVQFPANARFGIPLVLALRHVGHLQRRRHRPAGPGPLLRELGVPAARRHAASSARSSCTLLLAPIEFLSTFIIRPFSLMVRLFANMLAGHLILTTFAVLTAALWAAKITVIIAPLSFGLLVAMTGFEVLVSFLQAFIFAILTAVYIDISMHPAH